MRASDSTYLVCAFSILPTPTPGDEHRETGRDEVDILVHIMSSNFLSVTKTIEVG